MKRAALLIANWKMQKTLAEVIQYFDTLVTEAKGNYQGIAIAPSFTALSTVHALCRDRHLKIPMGAQDVCAEMPGAYTGEVSAEMLQDVGCMFVIIGHSERRAKAHESNALIHQKINRCIEASLAPVLCVGERAEEKEEGKTMEVIKTQLVEALEGLSAEQLSRLVIAYEPVWAIGTGNAATPEDANGVHQAIRELLASLYDEVFAYQVRIIYGGSVKPSNIKSYMGQPDIDGALIGGASLDAKAFIQLQNNSGVC